MLRIGLVKWNQTDGLAGDLAEELVELGHDVCVSVPADIPETIDVVVTYAPWGRMLDVTNRLRELKERRRSPVFLHWNLENPPDLSIPWPILRLVSGARINFDRLHDTRSSLVRRMLDAPPLTWLDRRMIKFRYLGEYYHISEEGWLNTLAETSLLFSGFHRRHGLNTCYVPWGTSPNWHQELNLERDIDVLWLGNRRTKRRSHLIDAIREKLRQQGFNMMVIDGVEHRFVFGEERIRLLNRVKIAVHLNMHWYDNSFHMRFHMIAGNRAMVVAERLPPHYTEYCDGLHYIASDSDRIVDQIVYYLTHEEERRAIAARAYELVTDEMCLGRSIERLVGIAESELAVRR